MPGPIIMLSQLVEEEGPVIEEEAVAAEEAIVTEAEALAPKIEAAASGLAEKAEALAQEVEAEGEAILNKIENALDGAEVDEIEQACTTQGPIQYGSSDLSQQAMNYRQSEGLFTGRNVAVFEYEAPDGSLQTIARASERGVGHAERIIGDELEQMDIDLSKVTRIYSELEPCNAPGGYCASYIERTFPNADVTWSFEYGETAESRAVGVEALKAAAQGLR